LTGHNKKKKALKELSLMLDEVVYDLIKNTNIKEFIRNYYSSDFKRGWGMDGTHSHAAIEIDYVQDGAAFYKFEKEIVKISKNNLLLILPNVPHQLFVEYDCKLMHISLNLNQIINGDAEKALQDIGNIFCTETTFLNIGYLRANDDSSINDSIKKIVFELENKKDSYELMVKIILSALFVKLKRILNEKMENEGSYQRGHIEKAMNYITLTLPYDLTPETISNFIHISCDYLKHIFKKYTGYSVMEYVAYKRIELAKQLMQNTDLKISDIAMDVGIGNFQYFSTLFKKYTGVTPSQYRKMNQSTNYDDSIDGKNYHICTD
jgi:AraC-like DNA-binding protein/mannose-6-phosphate isomerase-like protein (cupin superfamily)